MEECNECELSLPSKKVLECKFCDKHFCSFLCLTKHSLSHSNSSESKIFISTSLRKQQSKDQTEQYSFITPGIFTDKYIYNKEYEIKNFSKVYDGFIPVELGTGAFARVYLVTHNITRKKYALKVINKHKLIQTYGNCQLIENEIEIHSKLNHPNIIRLYNVSETEEEINILLEYAENGNLYSLIKKENGISENSAFNYFIQIVNAVYFLHQNNIIHRDIKPENILIGENNKVKLCDFGWAKELTLNNRSTFCGTVEYMAPEIVGSELYDCSVDVWSLGILLYELLMGHSPFKSQKEKNTMRKIKIHNLVFDKNKYLSQDCINLIKGLLDANPLNRLKLKDIFEHPFIIRAKKNLQIRNSKRKESLDDSNENILMFFLKKHIDSKEKLKKKYGFDSKLSLRDKLSSKQLAIGEFQSGKNLIFPKLDDKKIERRESERLAHLIGNMSNEIEKGRKKIDDLNFEKSKQFSFEDFRDGSILYEKNSVNEINESKDYSKTKETIYSTNNENSIGNIPEEDDDF